MSSVISLALSMEKSVRDAVQMLSVASQSGSSRLNRLAFLLWPETGEDLRSWVMDSPWFFRLEMDLKVFSRQPGRLLLFLAWLRGSNKGWPVAENEALPVHKLFSGSPSLVARLLYRIRRHTLRIAVQAERSVSGTLTIRRRMHLDGREYEV